jgi:hypothetical protein
MTEIMQNASKSKARPRDLPLLLWCGLALCCAAIAKEGALTGTVYAQVVPNALLRAWMAGLVGFGMYLFACEKWFARTELPSQRVLLIWAALGALFFALGWMNVRGAMNHLVTDSERNFLVSSGLIASLGCAVMVVVCLIRYLRRLTPQQRTLWQQMWKWPAILLCATPVVSLAVFLIVSVWLEWLSRSP